MGSVKAAKAAARQFRESGSKPREAAKAALTATGAAKREKQKKRKRTTPAEDGEAALKVPRVSHVYAGAMLCKPAWASTHCELLHTGLHAVAKQICHKCGHQISQAITKFMRPVASRAQLHPQQA
jgi:hypothetical protein